MDTLDDRLTGLALCWLLTRPRSRRGTRPKLEEALRPLVEPHLGRAAWNERFAVLGDSLLAREWVTAGRRGVLELTEPGRAQALRFLSVDTLPRALSWKRLQDTFLQALSLGLPTSRTTLAWVGTEEGVRAAVLQRQHGLEGELPTLVRVRERLMWRQLEVETDEPLSLTAVRLLLLGELLGQEVDDVDQAMAQLAARAVGAPRADVAAVRLANLRAWLASSPEPAPEPEDPPSGERFARQVLAVARALPSERRFGTDKVFIAHVWRALQPAWSQRRAFDAALLEANRARHLSLSRADLVSVMDPTDVAESEVSIGSARFHFVVV